MQVDVVAKSVTFEDEYISYEEEEQQFQDDWSVYDEIAETYCQSSRIITGKQSSKHQSKVQALNKIGEHIRIRKKRNERKPFDNW